MGLTTTVKEYALAAGASLVGVASADRFVGAPAGHGPRDFVRGAESVVSIGIKLPDAVVDRFDYLADAVEYPPEVRARLLETHIYTKQGYALPNLMLDEIAFRVTQLLESRGYRTIPFPASYASYTMPDVSSADALFFGLFSHRHAAVRAGLGEFGLNNLVITPQFGPRVRFASIVTAAPLDADPLVSQPVCLRDECQKCVRACASHAICPRPDRPDGLFFDPPSRTYVRGCNNRPSGTPLGTCLAVCPVGELRTAQ